VHHVTRGTLLADRYAVDERLGAGGGGEVWAADDTRLGRRVAVKVVAEGDGGERLQREARAAAGVNHPNVVQVYDAGIEDGLVYLVMEYVDGVDLATLLSGVGALGPELALLIGHDLALGLARVHEAGLVHRDVKPGNVLVTPDGRAKLADLGIARRTTGTDAARLTEAGTVMGTIDYLAPEQVEDVDVGPTADVYAVGLVVHAACTGAPPFGTGTAAERTGRRLARGPAPLDVAPAGLRRLVAAATARVPGDRPVDGAELEGWLGAELPDDVEPLRARLARLVHTARPPGGGAARAAGVGTTRAVAPGTPVPAPHPTDDPAELPSQDPDATRAWSPAAFSDEVPSDEVSREATRALPLDAPDAAHGGWSAGGGRSGGDAEEAPDGPRTLGLLGRTVVAAVVVAGIVTVLASGGPTPAQDAPVAVETTTPVPTPTGGGPLPVVAVVDHDPFGDDGRENPGLAALAVDGDPTTAWESVGYATRAFGGLKPGLGLLLDLGEQRDVASVSLLLGGTGHDVSVTVLQDRPTGDPTLVGDVLGEATDVGGGLEVAGGPLRGRWVAVWATRLGTVDGRPRLAVAEVEVRG
jgi:serine/threonine-protein kinase